MIFVVLIFVLIFLWFAYTIGADSTKSEINNFKLQTINYNNTIKELNEKLQLKENEFSKLNVLFNELNTSVNQQLNNLYNNGILLPSLTRWANFIREQMDLLKHKENLKSSKPAPKASQRISEANTRARVAELERDILRNRIDLYEAQAPWLVEYADLTVEEILAGLQAEKEIHEAHGAETDPAEIFLSKNELLNLDIVNKYQLALDRFLDRTRARSSWAAGIEYERYIGFIYEENEWMVKYQGATQGRKDLGIDLICTKNNEIHIIQCKRLSKIKKLPVRENTVSQLHGATEFIKFDQKLQNFKIQSIIYTTYELSNTAKRFSEALKIVVKENFELKPYPRIKCNISKQTKEKIYHLPFDQQYDRTVISKKDGEKYVTTVAEAESLGFRRAFRWRG